MINSLLNEFCEDLSEVNLLDVGAGPISTFLGQYDKKVNIIPIDPLANIYNDLIQKHHPNIVHETPTIQGDGENICEQFNDKFDVVCSKNALDHAYDPLTVIKNMVSLSKRFTYIKGNVNEGKNENYTGLHQWDFSVTNDGDVMLTNADKSVTYSLKKELNLDNIFVLVDNTIHYGVVWTQMQVLIFKDSNTSYNKIESLLLQCNNRMNIDRYDTLFNIRVKYTQLLDIQNKYNALQKELNDKLSDLYNLSEKYTSLEMSVKRDKISEIVKVIEQLFPQNSIRRDVAKIAYKIVKKLYKLIKKQVRT